MRHDSYDPTNKVEYEVITDNGSYVVKANCSITACRIVKQSTGYRILGWRYW